MEINVLWIDDKPNEAFMDNAYNQGIVITSVENVDAGIEKLLEHTSSFDAIILDANCLSHKADDPSIPEVSALQYALRKITEKRITLPWFVYSGGGFEGEQSISILVKGYERPYDDHDWYRKPVERNALFDKIKQVIPKMSEYKIKDKYSDILCWYPRPKELIEILRFVEEGKFNDPDVFAKIRTELEFITKRCKEVGLLQQSFPEISLKDCSVFLCQKALEENDFVKIHVQASFRSAVNICNEGSHELKIKEYVRSGNAPYLVQSTVYEFLNILTWFGTLPSTEEGMEVMRMDVKEALENNSSDGDKEFKTLKRQYESETVIVEKDDDGICHCGDCLVSSRDATPYIGKEVKLCSIKKNTRETKDRYPLFGRIKVEK